ncbi:MAG: formate dehydrogenase major subunit [Acidimicrobiaceae bacterium]|jgi:formate dehydrogenase major subunit|nr:formate dehydrogenase major subunit [Acidimicrobiaceae bacterium]
MSQERSPDSPSGRAGARLRLGNWPVLRQLTGADHLGLGEATASPHSQGLRPRTEEADSVVASVCPYCAVGCGQQVFVSKGRITQIEGDPASPISRGRLCPKGSASFELVTGSYREQRVKYRAPHAEAWQDISLDRAMDMVADRVIATRAKTWQDADEQGRPLRRTMGIASLGGATLDNEENYLMKKLYTALGAIQIENQARI